MVSQPLALFDGAALEGVEIVRTSSRSLRIRVVAIAALLIVVRPCVRPQVRERQPESRVGWDLVEKRQLQVSDEALLRIVKVDLSQGEQPP